MKYETIKYEKGDRYCIVTLNRPEALNALNWQMEKELDDAYDEIMKDNEINVFVYTGAPRPDGRPCFSAGGDLKEYAKGEMNKGGAENLRGMSFSAKSSAMALWSQRKWRLSIHGPKMPNIAWSPKISIAAIDGVCTAGGLELALSCDLILVSETAQIMEMHVKNMGIIGGSAAGTLLAWRVGVSKAIQLCCTGDPIDGKEAHRIGLADELFSPDKLMDGARELASKIGSMRPMALTMTKATCTAVRDMHYNEAWLYSDACLYALEEEPDQADWGPRRWLKRRR